MRSPRIVGVESDPRHVAIARAKFDSHENVTILEQDFLKTNPPLCNYVIGNPPYIPITGLSEDEKADYRGRFLTAVERFDLYLLFFEQALKALKALGRLVFITPEKFLYVNTAAPLRRLLAARGIEEIRLIEEESFGKLVTYPTITAVSDFVPYSSTMVTLRDGRTTIAHLSSDGSSWLPLILKQRCPKGFLTLEKVCERISCGVATGADSVFVKETKSLGVDLQGFAYPTIAGRELTSVDGGLHSRNSMLVPYRDDGQLIAENKLGALKAYFEQPDVRSRLLKRTCVIRKPWYSFHENPPLAQILRPKILCKDIAVTPRFWIDWKGDLLPRHSVYYIVPTNPTYLKRLNEYLNSEIAHAWLRSNCQRASNGYLRLQSHVLKRLPIPGEFAQMQSVTERRDTNTRILREGRPLRKRIKKMSDVSLHLFN